MTTPKSFPRTERDKINDQHCYHPEPGDYWHEMFSPSLVVLGVAAGMVVYCETTKSAGKDHWTWDLDKREVKPLAEFAKMLRYDTIDATIGCCRPRAHMWAVDHVSGPQLLSEE